MEKSLLAGLEATQELQVQAAIHSAFSPALIWQREEESHCWSGMMKVRPT